MDSEDLGDTGTGISGVSRLERSLRGPCTPAHLDTPVVYPGGLALDAAGVAAAGAALHLHAGRPYQEIGRGGVDLAPRDLVDHRPCLAHRWDGLLCGHRESQPRVSSCSHPRAPTGTRHTWDQCSQSPLVTGRPVLSAVCFQLSSGATLGTGLTRSQSPALK